MTKKVIQNGDEIFATGVKLRRDTTVNGGWVVTGFEDESYFESVNVQDKLNEETGKMEYWIDNSDE